MDGLLKRGHGMETKLIFVREGSGKGIFFEFKINSQKEQLKLFNNFSVGRWCESKYIYLGLSVSV